MKFIPIFNIIFIKASSWYLFLAKGHISPFSYEIKEKALLFNVNMKRVSYVQQTYASRPRIKRSYLLFVQRLMIFHMHTLTCI
jgi:hypothetical protein